MAGCCVEREDSILKGKREARKCRYQSVEGGSKEGKESRVRKSGVASREGELSSRPANCSLTQLLARVGSCC